MLEFKISEDTVEKLVINGDTHTVYKELMKAVCDILMEMRLEKESGRVSYSDAVTEFGQHLILLAQKRKNAFDVIDALRKMIEE
jgi:hypothetical protein